MLLRVGIFGAAHGWGDKKASLPNVCHTYPAMKKLSKVIPYLKKIQKYINHVTHPLSSADISIFHRKSANFAISINTDIDCNLKHNFQFFFTSFESLKTALINMVTILMMSAKMATPDLLKIQVIWNKGCDLIFSVHDVNSEIISRNSIYIIDVVMLPKFGNSSISVSEVIITSIL